MQSDAAPLPQPLVQKTLKKRMPSELVRRLGANEALFWGGAVCLLTRRDEAEKCSSDAGSIHGLSTHEVVRQYQEVIGGARPDLILPRA